jgi:SSS family solute:Na+ symporter
MLRRIYNVLIEHLPLFATLSFKDHVVIVAYFLLTFAVAFYFSRRKKSSADYFLGGRSAGWIVIGTSLFATSISGVHVLGLPAMGSMSGVAAGYFELYACLMVIVLGWIFAPFYLKSGVFTMPEFLARRFNSSSGWILSVVSIALYLLTTVSFSLYAGAIFLKAVVGIDMTTSAIVIISAVGLYTVLGGLTASLYTHFIQAGILVLSSFALAWKTLKGSGGWSSLVANTPTEFWSIFKPISDPDFPWTGILFGAPIIGLWYWCTDQYVVQRVLSAKNIDHARRGTILAGFLKLLPLFLLVLPGIIAMSASNGYITGDKTYGWLVMTFLPSGWRGLAIAGVLAAMMCSIEFCLHSPDHRCVQAPSTQC